MIKNPQGQKLLEKKSNRLIISAIGLFISGSIANTVESIRVGIDNDYMRAFFGLLYISFLIPSFVGILTFWNKYLFDKLLKVFFMAVIGFSVLLLVLRSLTPIILIDDPVLNFILGSILSFVTIILVMILLLLMKVELDMRRYYPIISGEDRENRLNDIRSALRETHFERVINDLKILIPVYIITFLVSYYLNIDQRFLENVLTIFTIIVLVWDKRR
ncbi:MAG: hypothetical protein INQ03_18920 [Candidatus Heimdallarchaeota archaeon]|nr:hypothetical protein [Candidatus Heimdallarchaeota archaeon]